MAKATTKTAATKVENDPKKSPEHKMRMRIGRTIGRGIWMTGFKAEHPTADKDQQRAAWGEARKDFTKIGFKALKALEKAGYEVVEKPA